MEMEGSATALSQLRGHVFASIDRKIFFAIAVLIFSQRCIFGAEKLKQRPQDTIRGHDDVKR